MDAEDLSNCKTLMADGLVIACHLDEMHELVLSNAKSTQNYGCFGFWRDYIYRGYTEDDILSKYVGDSFVNHDTRIPIKQLNY